MQQEIDATPEAESVPQWDMDAMLADARQRVAEALKREKAPPGGYRSNGEDFLAAPNRGSLPIRSAKHWHEHPHHLAEEHSAWLTKREDGAE